MGGPFNLRVDQERGSLGEEPMERVDDVLRQFRGPQGVLHQLKPAVAGGLVDDERSVSDSETGMSAFGDVPFRTTQSINEKLA